MDAAVSVPQRSAYRTIGVVGAAHFVSHFFQLAVPAVFPLIKSEFAVSYAELGLLATLFYLSSGLSQFVAGFLVDHFGARWVLFTGVGLLAGGIMLCGFAPSYSVLAVLMIIAGAGNSVFHPADYSILNATVPERQLGRAYGVHTLGGNLGWAVSPATVFGLASMAGWRSALVIVGLAGLTMLGFLISQSALLAYPGLRHLHRTEAARPTVRAIFLSPAVLLCFAYFVLLAIATIGMQNFLPAILQLLHGFPLGTTNGVLTAFLLGSSSGTIAGAMLADHTGSHYRIVAIGLSLAAALIWLVIYVGSPAVVTVILACAGLGLGSTLPSRDMVVRRATPRGASGRVFGFVYSGLDAGSALAPASVGVLLDHGAPRLVLFLLGLALILAIGTTTLIQGVEARRRAGR